jgi:hypothetical protein
MRRKAKARGLVPPPTVEDQPLFLLQAQLEVVQPRQHVQVRALRGGAPTAPRQHVGPYLGAREEGVEVRGEREARGSGGGGYHDD